MRGGVMVPAVYRYNAKHPENQMPNLTIIAFDGTQYDFDVQDGSTVMENAVRNSVPGIEAECGGACACPAGAPWLQAIDAGNTAIAITLVSFHFMTPPSSGARL